MDSKFFDIPFLTLSPDSDFICKDGEVASFSNLKVMAGGRDISTGYSDLLPAGCEAPVPDIDFAITRGVLHGWHVNPDVFPMKTLVASDPTMEYWNKLSALLLAEFQSDAERQKLFVAPFYVMAAWRTLSGSLVSPSSPEMLVPNSCVPPVTTDEDTRSAELEFKIAAALGSLCLRMRTPESLRDHVGKIDSLEILVSPPLQRYSTFDILLPCSRVVPENTCICLDMATGNVTETKVCTQTLPLAWKALQKDYTESRKPDPANDIRFIPFARIPLSEVDLFHDWTSVGSKGSYFLDYHISSENQTPSSSRAILYGCDGDFLLITRPLKLTKATELKAVTKVALRGDFDSSRLNILIEGSRDMKHWFKIAYRKGGTTVFLPRSSFRFYRFKISGTLSSGENLQGLSITI